MMVTLLLLGAVLTWLGGALITLSHGRRGLALGQLVLGAGLSATAYATGHETGSALLAAATAVVAGLRLLDADPGWGVIPRGSTPRLVLCLVTLVAVLLLATSIRGFTVTLMTTLFGAILTATRVLGADRPAVALAALSGLALSLAAMADTGVVVAGAIIAALLAAYSATLAASGAPQARQ
jgi:hypothetical protein